MKKAIYYIFACAAIFATIPCKGSNKPVETDSAVELMDNEVNVIKLKGTIGTYPIVMTLRDTGDGEMMDGGGVNWDYTGSYTYTNNGSTFKLTGYWRHLYLFLDETDSKGKNTGHFELEMDGDGAQGTFTNLTNGKKYKVKLKEVN